MQSLCDRRSIKTNHLRPSWIEIDLPAISNNVRQIRKLIGPDCLLMAIVKGNAYGHGAVEVAKTVLTAGANRLGVAMVSEAAELRSDGITAPILVLGYTPAELAEHSIALNVALTVYDLITVEKLQEAARRLRQTVPLHLKVNTGMNRLGIRPAEVPAFIEQMQMLSHVHLEGIFSHFSTADGADESHSLAQFAVFSELLNELDASNLRPPIAHCANSAATLKFSQSHLQMVRSGIALYGLHPDPKSARLPASFRPVLSWKARIAQVIQLKPGDAVSYGREFVAKSSMTAAIIPVGYADGFPRKPRNWSSVLIHGQFAPILGRVCMDQTIVDVTEICDSSMPVRQGDEVVLIGRQGENDLSAEEVGRRLGTINYDVVSRILPRVPRIFNGC